MRHKPGSAAQPNRLKPAMTATGKDAKMNRTLEQTTMRKVALRLVPFLCVLYTIAFIDRINVGFAALSMSADLGLSPQLSVLEPGCSSSAIFSSRSPAT